MNQTSITRTPPGLRQYLPFLPLGLTARYQRDPIQVYLDCARQFGDLFCLQFGPVVLYVIRHPDYVKHVLHDHVDNYPRGKLYSMFSIGVGKGLIATEGEFWRRQRGLTQPAFDRGHVATFAAHVAAATGALCARWDAHAEDGRPIDVAAEMTRLSLAVVGNAIFGTDISDPADPRARSLTTVREYVNWRITHLFSPPVYFPTRRNYRFLWARRAFDQFLYGLIDARRRENRDGGDLLSRMICIRDPETGKRLSDSQMRDEMMAFFMAGWESVGALLAWAWYLLSENPDVDSRFRAELAQVLGGRAPGVADLPNLRYTHMVVQETLRLYPTVWLFAREPVRDDVIGGYHIRAGSTVLLAPYITHRHEAFWPDPEKFDPERFTPERSANRHSHAYFPFCAGPHECVGKHFVLMAVPLIVATIAQAYRLRLVPGYSVEPEGTVIARPRYGIRMTVHRAETGCHHRFGETQPHRVTDYVVQSR